MAALTFEKLLLQLQRATHMRDRRFTAKTLALFRFDPRNSQRFVAFINHTMKPNERDWFNNNCTMASAANGVLSVALNGGL